MYINTFTLIITIQYKYKREMYRLGLKQEKFDIKQLRHIKPGAACKNKYFSNYVIISNLCKKEQIYAFFSLTLIFIATLCNLRPYEMS